MKYHITTLQSFIIFAPLFYFKLCDLFFLFYFFLNFFFVILRARKHEFLFVLFVSHIICVIMSRSGGHVMLLSREDFYNCQRQCQASFTLLR